MATMKFYNVNAVPTAASPEGTYHVKRADNPDRIDTYVVSNGTVKKQENNDEKIVQLSSETNRIDLNKYEKFFDVTVRGKENKPLDQYLKQGKYYFFVKSIDSIINAMLVVGRTGNITLSGRDLKDGQLVEADTKDYIPDVGITPAYGAIDNSNDITISIYGAREIDDKLNEDVKNLYKEKIENSNILKQGVAGSISVPNQWAALEFHTDDGFIPGRRYRLFIDSPCRWNYLRFGIRHQYSVPIANAGENIRDGFVFDFEFSDPFSSFYIELENNLTVYKEPVWFNYAISELPNDDEGRDLISEREIDYIKKESGSQKNIEKDLIYSDHIELGTQNMLEIPIEIPIGTDCLVFIKNASVDEIRNLGMLFRSEANSIIANKNVFLRKTAHFRATMSDDCKKIHIYRNNMINAEFDLEIYRLYDKSSIRTGRTNIAYNPDKNLPKGVGRVDIISDTIKVNSNNTLSGVPANGTVVVDFKMKTSDHDLACKAEFSYQGTSSMSYLKKNFSIDLLDDNGDSLKVKIGDWRPMDGYHLKANWVDSLHCRNIVSSWIYEQIYMSRERPWAVYNNFSDSDLFKRMDTGALGHIDGFPVEIYVNNSYIGLYTFNLKKHRDNYNMRKDDTQHIQLEMASGSTFKESVVWSEWEIRNPKSDSGNSTFEEGKEPNAGEVKTAIQRWMTFLANVNSDTPKEEFSEYLNVKEWIDFHLFNVFTCNYDSIVKNTQLCSWDGLHLSPLPYDLDSTFGMMWDGSSIRYNAGWNIYNYARQPFWNFFSEIFSDEISRRYIELRSSGIFSRGNVENLLNKFVRNIETAAYLADYSLWPNIPSNSNWYASVEQIADFTEKKAACMDAMYSFLPPIDKVLKELYGK